MTASSSQLPLVAIVGRPNVGKSTLFNRLVGGRPAMVEDVPGVTRDRRYGESDWNGRRFRVVDTGGMDPSAESGAITQGIHRQAKRAIDEADVIVFVCDAREGLTSTDRDVGEQLRKSGRPVILVANKVDAPSHEAEAAEFYGLGLGEPFAISATHGRGSADLLDAVLAELPEAKPGELTSDAEAPSDGEGEGEDETIGEGEAAALARAARPPRIAFVGKPNVGKSSLVNRLLGEERVLVHDAPGTTTDPVDTEFEFEGETFVLVDTAGIRKRARVEEQTEKISVSMALGQIKRADVALLVIDATQGPTDQDAKIAGAIEDAGAATIIVVNKEDLLGTGRTLEDAERKLREQIREVLPFLSFAPIRFVAARTGQGVADLIRATAAVRAEHSKRIGTSELNRFFQEVCETHPPPTFRSKTVRIYYISQPGANPPIFVLWANRPELVHYHYRRFLMNQLRERFGFEGSPLRIVTRRRGGKGRE